MTGLYAMAGVLAVLLAAVFFVLGPGAAPAGERGVVAPVALGACGVLAALFVAVRVLADLRRGRWRRRFAAEGAWNAHIAELDRLQARRRWLGFAICTALVLAGALVYHGAHAVGERLHPAFGMPGLMLAGGVLLAAGLGGQALLLLVRPGDDAPPPEPPIMLYNEPLTVDQAHELVGREGVVRAALRPQGSVRIAGATYVVKSEGQFVEEGTPVRVDRIEGPNIVVVPVGEAG